MADRTFTITATMGERWVPQFLGLLREMQRNGAIGHSAVIGLYSDGDGDFHPKFEWDTDAQPAFGRGGALNPPEVLFDAG